MCVKNSKSYSDQVKMSYCKSIIHVHHAKVFRFELGKGPSN